MLLIFSHYPHTEFRTFPRRLLCPQWMEDGRKHKTIHNHDSPGLRKEIALHRFWDLWAVSFWLDVAADVGWLWCVEPVKKLWTEQDCGSSCGARSVTHMQWVRRPVLEYDFRRATLFSGFSTEVHVPSPCRLRNAPALILHNCWRLLEPDACRRAHSYGMRTSCCQWWCFLVKWEHSWANDVRSKSEKINLDESDYTESMYLYVTFLEHLSV